MRGNKHSGANNLSKQIRHYIAKLNSSKLQGLSLQADAQATWKAVREYTGQHKSDSKIAESMTAGALNDHYAAISHDSNHTPLQTFNNSSSPPIRLTEQTIHRAISSLRKTATGPDNVPYCALKLGVDYLSKPICHLVNKFLEQETVPEQWRTAIIKPIAKVSNPTTASDYRPISITSVLSRTVERLLIRQYIHPKIMGNLSYNDQYAFRPTGSTTAAIIAITTAISEALEENPMVRLIAFDFSKAFDTLKHNTVIDSFHAMGLPDGLLNWISSFLSNRTHKTEFGGKISALSNINCSVVQGSALGPIAFIAASSRLSPLNNGNKIVKYADDTYIIIPQPNFTTTRDEINNIQKWARANNLFLNSSKSKEIIFQRPRHKGPLPPTLETIPRHETIKILGVTITNKISIEPHITETISKCSGMLYALKILRCHGLNINEIHQLYSSLLVSRILYASPSWWGFTNSQDKSRLQAVINRSKRFGICHPGFPNIESLVKNTEKRLFNKLMENENHVLHALLPPVQESKYNLRKRAHNISLPTLNTYNQRGYLFRMLFSPVM